MRVTKVMLTEENKQIRNLYNAGILRERALELRVTDLEKVVRIYQGMSSLTIATERITDALVRTIGKLKERS